VRVGATDPSSNDAFPGVLTRLLDARDAGAEDVAWREFVAANSALVLQVARSTGTTRDAAMDAYTFVLEQLREQKCRRLRAYTARDGARFSTWLLVVTKRLCVDFHRRRYGRPQGTTEAQPHDSPSVERSARRRLVDLTAEAIDPDTIADADGRSPEAELRLAQLRRVLATALERLEPADRLLLAMRFEDQRPASEIARALGFATQFHVYRRLNKLLEELRATLEARGVDGPAP
jgi:RNA polymerase sigma factor (sigma-70 family)